MGQIRLTDREQFKLKLVAHQQGKTDFLTFIKMCVSVGIEKWKICMENMTCTYYDKAGNEILVEVIPHLKTMVVCKADLQMIVVPKRNINAKRHDSYAPTTTQKQ